MLTAQSYIGIDIGGTTVKLGLVDEHGQYAHLRRIETQAAASSQARFCAVLLENITQIAALDDTTIAGVGICLPGLQRPDAAGTVYSVNVPALNNLDLKHFFEGQLNVPCSVINDLIAHGLAESRFGSGRQVDRFLSVSMGTGIGHAFIKAGKPVYLHQGISGDSGRMVIDIRSPICDSSQVCGSAEALCGIRAIELLLKEQPQARHLRTAFDVITAARETDDRVAREIMITISQRVAHLLMNLSCLFFPEVIALTGGQTEAGMFFIESCQREFERISADFFEEYYRILGEEKRIRIVKAEAGGLAGLIGSIVPLL